MSLAAKRPRISIDWYEEVCQRLEALKQSTAKYADRDDVLPNDGAYELAKQTLRDLRQLAGFPDLHTPDVWLGPDGEIGVTWESGDRSLELIFFESTVMARLTIDSKESVLEPKVIPVELKKFAA